LELFFIIHARSLLVEVFFKGVHRKKPYSYILSMLDNSFYRLFFSKISPPLSQLIPSHIKLNDFSEITRIKMCFCIARVFDDHRSCQKLMNYITTIKTMLKRYYWIQKLPVLQRLFIQNLCKRNRCLEENPVFLFLSK
jgi:hypothetical protein